jgi:hypothetical protein
LLKEDSGTFTYSLAVVDDHHLPLKFNIVHMGPSCVYASTLLTL